MKTTKLVMWSFSFSVLVRICQMNECHDVHLKANASSPKIWSQFKNNSWVCGSSVNYAIQCQDDSDYIKIARCYCIYYDFNTNSSQFGTCMATCFHPQFGTYFKVKRYSVENASLFNKAMCVESSSTFQYLTNSTGRFCGRCKEGYGLSVYSYQYSVCIPCNDFRYINWLKYLAISLVPLTIFYFLTVVLKINFISSYLSGVVTSIQIMASPLNLFILRAWENSNSFDDGTLFQLYSALYSSLNLDFFRDLYTPFCFNPTFNTLQVISLDYISALFPFVLIIFTYFLIQLYDRKFVLVVWTWKPFKFILQGYYKQLSVRTSLVETFATFLLLSSVKIASISLFLLMPVALYNEQGMPYSKWYLYMDSNIVWFGMEHLPYGLLALVTIIAFVLLPLVLMLLYPCRCFQKLLNKAHLNSQTLRVFMDAFQGCYRLEPYDMRYFSAYYLFLRVLVLCLMGAFKSLFAFSATTLCLVLNAICVYTFQPCRSPAHNKIDSLAMSILVLFYVSLLVMNSTFYLDIYWLVESNVAFSASQIIIGLFFVVTFGWTLFRHKLRKLVSKVLLYFSKKKEHSCEDEGEDSLLSFSERSPLI